MKLRYLLAGIMGTFAIDLMANNLSGKYAAEGVYQPKLSDCITYCQQVSSSGQCTQFDRGLGTLCDNYLDSMSFVINQ